MGFEPTRAEPNGLAVHRLNHSATSSTNNAALCVDAHRKLFSGRIPSFLKKPPGISDDISTYTLQQVRLGL